MPKGTFLAPLVEIWNVRARRVGRNTRRLKRADYMRFPSTAGSAAWPFPLRAQQPLPVIGYLNSTSPRTYAIYLTPFERDCRVMGTLSA